MSFITSPQQTWPAGQLCGPRQPTVVSVAPHEFEQLNGNPLLSRWPQQICPGQSSAPSQRKTPSHCCVPVSQLKSLPLRQQYSPLAMRQVELSHLISPTPVG